MNLDWLKGLFQGKDDKPVMLSFVLQQDECSRLLGEFGEKHLADCQALVIIWEDKEGHLMAISSGNVGECQAAGMSLKAALVLGSGNGS